MTIEHLDASTVKHSYLIARAINHRLRQQMLEHLMEAGNDGLTVGEVYTDPRYYDVRGAQMEQSVASAHLGVLRRQNIVWTEREGKFIRYRVNLLLLRIICMMMEAMSNAVNDSDNPGLAIEKSVSKLAGIAI